MVRRVEGKNRTHERKADPQRGDILAGEHLSPTEGLSLCRLVSGSCETRLRINAVSLRTYVMTNKG